MTKDPNREPLHPAYICRRLMECLPPEADQVVAQTVIALFAFSGQYMMKPDLEAGRISFNGTVSYGQLGAFCRVHRDTAKWRCEEIRDRWHIIEWRRSQHGIRFKVFYSANRLTDSEESTTGESPDDAGVTLGGRRTRSGYGLPDSVNRDLISESSQGTDKSSQGTEAIESGYRGSEVGYGYPTLSLNCPTPLSTSSVCKAVDDDNPQVLKNERSTSTAKPTETSKPPKADIAKPVTETSLAAPSLRQQEQEGAAPVRRCSHGLPLKVRCGYCLRIESEAKSDKSYPVSRAEMAAMEAMLQQELDALEEKEVQPVAKCVSRVLMDSRDQ